MRSQAQSTRTCKFRSNWATSVTSSIGTNGLSVPVTYCSADGTCASSSAAKAIFTLSGSGRHLNHAEIKLRH